MKDVKLSSYQLAVLTRLIKKRIIDVQGEIEEIGEDENMIIVEMGREEMDTLSKVLNEFRKHLPDGI